MRIIVATVFVVLLTGTAFAQDDHAHWARLAQANQHGLLMYCAAQGLLDAAIAVTRPGEASDADPEVVAAAKAGQAGIIRYVDRQATLTEDAAASGTTVAYRCQMMGLAVR